MEQTTTGLKYSNQCSCADQGDVSKRSLLFVGETTLSTNQISVNAQGGAVGNGLTVASSRGVIEFMGVGTRISAVEWEMVDEALVYF